MIGILMMLFSNIQAQETEQVHKTPEEHAKNQTEWMIENLKISKEQQKTAEEINLTYARKMEEMHVKNPKAGDKERDDINKAKAVEMKKILTPNQFKKYVNHLKSKKKHKKEK